MIGGHLRPGLRPSYFRLFCRSIRRPEQRDNTPPHVPHRLRLLSNAPPTVDANFWLVVVSPIKWWPYKSKGLPISLIFFCRSIRQPKWYDDIPPTCSALALPLFQFIPYCCHQLLVDCYLLRSNSSHLRPRHHPLSIIRCLSFQLTT